MEYKTSVFPHILKFTVFVLCISVIPAVFYISKHTGAQSQISGILETTSVALASPTPVPFEEITIPYLRKREYASSLASLQQVQNNSSYTSYLTSYNSDGFRVNGLLTIPRGERPQAGWPAIVFVHGYIPPRQYKTLEKYMTYVDYLARNGFVVFKIDLRGHGQSEGQPGGGYYGSDYVVDTLNAYAALESADFVDPEAVGLWGHSMAGNAVLRAMVSKPDVPASVIWAGAVYSYTDMQKYGLQDSSYQPLPSDDARRKRQQALFAQYGRPAEGNPFWNTVAPTNYLSDLKGAIQLHHAQNDQTVNIGYSTDLVDLLETAGISHELQTYPSGGHNISDPSFSIAMQRTVAFFTLHLK